MNCPCTTGPGWDPQEFEPNHPSPHLSAQLLPHSGHPWLESMIQPHCHPTAWPVFTLAGRALDIPTRIRVMSIHRGLQGSATTPGRLPGEDQPDEPGGQLWEADEPTGQNETQPKWSSWHRPRSTVPRGSRKASQNRERSSRCQFSSRLWSPLSATEREACHPLHTPSSPLQTRH